MNLRITHQLFECLCLPDEAFDYRFSQIASDCFPDRCTVVTNDVDFDVGLFARAGGCTLFPVETTHSAHLVAWDPDEERVDEVPRHGVFDVGWMGSRLHLVLASRDYTAWWAIAADSLEIAHRFFEAVCRFALDQADELCELIEGAVRRSDRLAKQIRGATLDDLTLTPKVRQALESDVATFFEGEERYAKVGVPWRRGILLYGPPGNGKTHAIRAIVAQANRPTIVARSFSGRHRTAERGIAALFTRARASAPSIVVMEDLDSLVPKANLSHLLNELDGLAPNRGVLTLATTNYPERLDPALRDRASRFDRKIEFANPAAAERRAYFERAFAEHALNEDSLAVCVSLTEGCSFAGLQEFRREALMRWLAQPDASLEDLLKRLKRKKNATG